MEIEDFEEKGNGITNIISIEDRPLTIHIRKDNDSDSFKISCYGYQADITYITSRDTLKEVDEVVTNICEKLEWAYEFAETFSLSKFISQIKKEYPKSPVNTRFRVTSADEQITMFVEYNHSALNKTGGYTAWVRDVECESHEYKEGQLHWAVPTEEEAERIVKERINEYDCFGYYTRKFKRQPTYRFVNEKECVKKDSQVEYVINNLSKEKYEFLMAQSEIYDNIK